MSFKTGQKVIYNTGANTGAGKIIAEHPTAKGVFYEVSDKERGKTYKLRAAKLTKA